MTPNCHSLDLMTMTIPYRRLGKRIKAAIHIARRGSSGNMECYEGNLPVCFAFLAANANLCEDRAGYSYCLAIL